MLFQQNKYPQGRKLDWEWLCPWKVEFYIDISSLRSPRWQVLPWSPPAQTGCLTVSTWEWLSRAWHPSTDSSWRPSVGQTWIVQDLVLGIYHSRTRTSAPTCPQPLATWTAVTPATTQWPTVQILYPAPRLSYISSGCLSSTMKATWGSGQLFRRETMWTGRRLRLLRLKSWKKKYPPPQHGDQIKVPHRMNLLGKIQPQW